MPHILIVEDDPDQLREYARYLRCEDGGNHQVDEAKSATLAVEMLQKIKYDLILLDIMIAYQEEDEKNPDIDNGEVDYGRKMGLHVYRKANELQQPPRIAIISVLDEVGILADFPNIVGRLGKYFRLENLGQSVRAWLRS